MKNFYAVWNLEMGPPRHQHLTFADAQKEAERLARANPSQHFHVIGTMGVAHCPAPPSIFTKSMVNIEDPAIPSLPLHRTWATASDRAEFGGRS